MPVCTAVSRVTEQYPAEQLTFLSDYMMIGKRRKKKTRGGISLLGFCVFSSQSPSHTHTNNRFTLYTYRDVAAVHLTSCGMCTAKQFTCLLCRHDLLHVPTSTRRLTVLVSTRTFFHFFRYCMTRNLFSAFQFSPLVVCLFLTELWSAHWSHHLHFSFKIIIHKSTNSRKICFCRDHFKANNEDEKKRIQNILQIFSG